MYLFCRLCGKFKAHLMHFFPKFPLHRAWYLKRFLPIYYIITIFATVAYNIPPSLFSRKYFYHRLTRVLQTGFYIAENTLCRYHQRNPAIADPLHIPSVCYGRKFTLCQLPRCRKLCNSLFPPPDSCLRIHNIHIGIQTNPLRFYSYIT